jgi:hypothetical protein
MKIKSKNIISKLVISLQFWTIWLWKKFNGLQNWKWKNVKSIPHEHKAEILRMWKAPNLPDDEIF